MSDIGEEYRDACARPSDINEHLPTLFALAAQCETVTEFGVRYGVSTRALLAGLASRGPGGVYRGWDLRGSSAAEEAFALGRAAGLTVEFREEDSRTAAVPDTDLLFIDSYHSYDVCRAELAAHAPRVRRWIVLHDTVLFGLHGQNERDVPDPAVRGLRPAVEELVAGGGWKIEAEYPNNNGLTILGRS